MQEIVKKSAADMKRAKALKKAKKSKALSLETPLEKTQTNVVTQYERLSIEMIRSLKGKDDVKEIVEAMCEQFGGVTPLSLQAGMVNGLDIRRTSVVFEVLRSIEEEMRYNFDAVPTEEQWDNLSHIIRTKYFFETVSIDDSSKAAKSLMDFTVPKLKQVEVISKPPPSPFAGQDIDMARLTVEEKKTFRRLLKKLKGE